ncbi:MAG: ATP-binding protein [Gammaproteobacteria bacterium]|nr:ATP-binding protein [Gammaproteobacteria bacterium]
MFKTLYAKLALGLVVMLAGMALVYGLVTYYATREYIAEMHQSLNRDLARNLVADRNLVAEGRLDEAALKSMFHDYMVINPSIEIYLLDLDGKILYFSADPGKVKRKSVSLEPIRAFLDNSASFPLLGDDPRSHDRRKVFSVTPVPSEEAPEGYLYVVLRGEEYDNVEMMAEESHFLRLSGWAVAASLAFGLLAGLIVFRVLTRRLQRLTGAMERFRLSDFGNHDIVLEPRKLAAPDEVDTLALTFEQMADRISEQIRELKNQDALRRDLVAQVSHDLRTPLASLHGYLETLKLKEDKLSATERADYLALVLRQSERLTRLVGELFELAKLDAKEARPQSEPFALPELVQDVLQKFQLKAAAEEVDLGMQLDDDLPLVAGDIALVERVLDNLIDNAIEHTPARGRVRVLVRRDAERLVLCVNDTGAGIPARDLPRVFDRFYRVGDAASGHGHAGLGLAIAKRIVELHGSELEVQSREGEGTTFAFALPVWRHAAARQRESA